jgi:hypothetical protein
MANQPVSFLSRTVVTLFARAGVYSANPGGQMPDGFGAMLLFSLLGAFFGLLAGLILTHIIRYVSFLMGRNLGGNSWAIYGALAGAILFGWLAAVGDEK